MRRGRIFFYLAFILILGMAAIVLFWQRFLVPQSAPAAAELPTPVIETVNVIVVAQKVPRGAVLDENVLSMIPIQRDMLVEGMYTNLDEVKGRMAKFDLDSGIPVTKGMLVEKIDQLSTTGSVAALSIPRGMVSVSIPIDRLSGVSYVPQPGDHVNVIVTLLLADYDPDFQTLLPNTPGLVLGPGPISPEEGPPAVAVYFKEGSQAGFGKAEIDPVLGQTFYVSPSEPQRPRMVSQALLQDAVILYVGEFSAKKDAEAVRSQLPGASPGPEVQATEVPPQNPGEMEDEEAPVEPQKPDLISLIVTPQDAITLNYLMLNPNARLSLALRSAGDDSRVQTEAVTLQFLLDQYNIPVPVKLPYGIPNRPEDDGLYSMPEPTPTPTP